MNRTSHAFLLIGLSVALSFAVGCSADPDPDADASFDADATIDAGDIGPETEVDTGEDVDSGADADVDAEDYTAQYFDTVRGVRNVLRESPDHLSAHADRLVEQGDAEQLWSFVRSQIALVPSIEGARNPAFEDSATAVIAGPRGALRSGAGTMRDRAELLAHLYRRAGWQATVVGPLPDAISRADYESELFTAVDHPVALPDESPELERARNFLPDTDTQNGELSVVEVDTSQLEQSLLDEIPVDERGSIATDDRQRLAMPIVRLSRGGDTLNLDVVSPGARFEDVASASGLSQMPTADYADVHVRLSFATTRQPLTWQPLIDRVWQANELVGRQLKLRFQSGTTIEEVLAANSTAVEVTAPILFAQDPKLTDAELLDLSAFGTPFTLTGTRITTDANDQIAVDGRPIVGDDTVGPVDQVEQFQSLEADPSSFQRVSLRVEALDAADAGVVGLGAGAFEVYEEGARVSHELRRNQVPPMRMLFLFDTSGSVASYWKQPEFAVRLGQQLDALQSAYIGGVEVAAANIDSNISQSRGPWVSDGSALEDQVRRIFESPRFNDPVWLGLEQAAVLDHDVTVVFSDAADTVSEFDPARELALSQGPPALLLGTGDLSPNADAMAEFTGGERLLMETYADVDQPLADWVGAQPSQQYILSFRAPTNGPSERQVELRTSDERVSATTTYTVPPPEAREVADSILGVRLEVAVDGRRATRVLAGVDPALLTSTELPDTLEDEIRRLVRSEYLIAIESQAPHFSQWMDDYLSYRLTQESLFRAYHTADTDLGLEALDQGYRHIDPSVFASYPPLDDPYNSTQTRTYATGPRISISSRWWDPDAEGVRRGFDILPISRFVTRSADGGSDFAETFRQTARFAEAEALNFETSTRSLLQGKQLTRIAPGAAFDPATDFSGTLDDASILWWRHALEQYERWHRFVPEEGQTRAFWVVHADTGEVYGILPNGTGGGTALKQYEYYEEIKEIVQNFDRYADIAAAHPRANTNAMIAIVNYFKLLVRMYAIAVIIIINLDPSALAEAVKAALLGFTCNFVKAVILNKIDNEAVSKGLDVFETLTAEFGIENPAACPDPFG